MAFSRIGRGRGIRLAIAPLAIGSALLSGCGKSEEAASLHCDRSAYVAQSREFAANEGRYFRATTTAQPIAKTYFGKAYNRDWLRNVAASSIADTIAYVESKGAAIYRAQPISEESGRHFEGMRTMPWEIEARWVHADSARRNGETCAFLTGLYLQTDPKVASLKRNAAIVLRQDANRWTLVHEFMHHNFRVQALAAGYDDAKLQAQRIDALGEVAAITRDTGLSTREIAKRGTPAFLRAVRAVDALMVQYAFEEIAIEAMLQDAYDAGDLEYVPAGAYGNAGWYIEHARKNAKKTFEQMDATYYSLRGHASTNHLFTEYHQLEEYFEIRDKRIADIDAMFKARAAARGGFGESETPSGPNVVTSADLAKKPSGKKPAKRKSAVSAGAIAETEAMAPCGHAFELDLRWEEINRDLARINRSLRRSEKRSF